MCKKKIANEFQNRAVKKTETGLKWILQDIKINWNEMEKKHN